ncbi:MAG: outer membrane protein assembly factor BamE [Azospirillaceae bacterium]
MTVVKRGRSFGLVVGGMALIALSAGCTQQVATRGNLVEDRRLEQVAAGQSTQDEVRSILGPPTSVATFDETVWYYIGQRTRQRAFLAPSVTERRVVRIAFDDTGRVAELEELDLEDARDVELVERETPTRGREIGILEQFLGNLGRFNTTGN